MGKEPKEAPIPPLSKEEKEEPRKQKNTGRNSWEPLQMNLGTE